MSDLAIEIPPKVKRKNAIALRPSQVVNKKRVVYEFSGMFLESFGKPEWFAKWFITGPSFSGKSSFLFILCEYLCGFGATDYNSFEEGNAQTVAEKILRHGLDKKEADFRLLPKVSIDDFDYRLTRKRSARFGVWDSVQHCGMTKRQYVEITNKHCNPRRGKSMIFVNHWVKNDLTKFIKHDCDIKIEVIGFVAHVESRYGGNKPFIIWEQGAKDFWGKNYKKVIEGKYWPGQKK